MEIFSITQKPAALKSARKIFGRILQRALCLMICSAIMSFSMKLALADGGIGTVLSVEGIAFARRYGTDTALLPNDRVFETDTLITGANSKLQIVLDDENSITIGPNSSVDIAELLNDENNVKLVSRREFRKPRVIEAKRKTRDNYVAIGIRSDSEIPKTLMDDAEEESNDSKPLEKFGEPHVEFAAKDVGLSEATDLINESWAIYWYICGSDLESKEGAATEDIMEALGVKLPENVKFVMQTGGAKNWSNTVVDSQALYRLEQTGDKIKILTKTPLKSMGDPETLYDFIKFCEANYPADRKALILWDHGGGSGGGICYDELHNNEFISFAGLKAVFEKLYGEFPEEKPFELIGFDACLMATLDMAGLAAPYARYMVASEEVEPGCGWQYGGILAALTRNPGMDGKELGRVICDTYYEDCNEYGVGDKITLSTIDLSKMEKLKRAMSTLPLEGYMMMINKQLEAPEFFADFSRGLKKTDTYYKGSEMADLGNLTKANSHLIPVSAARIAEAIEECVVYQVKGPYRENSSGISAYFPSLGNKEKFLKYEKSAEASGMKSLYYLYEPFIYGELSNEALEFLKMAANSLDDVPKKLEQYASSFLSRFQLTDTSVMGFDGHPLEIVEENGIQYLQLNLGPDKVKFLKSITFMLALYPDDDTSFVALGEDAGVESDWENGVFRDSFLGIWGSIDGHLVTTFVNSLTDGYILYDIPLRINGSLHHLTVVGDFKDVEYRMLSARLDESETGGIPPKEERLLTAGDEITTRFFGLSDEGLVPIDFETFTIHEDAAFDNLILPDGKYVYIYMMTDFKDISYNSEAVIMELSGGKAKFYK